MFDQVPKTIIRIGIIQIAVIVIGTLLAAIGVLICHKTGTPVPWPLKQVQWFGAFLLIPVSWGWITGSVCGSRFAGIRAQTAMLVSGYLLIACLVAGLAFIASSIIFPEALFLNLFGQSVGKQ